MTTAKDFKMTTFRDVHEAFRNSKPESFKCVAIVRGEPCPNELADGQKDKLRGLLDQDKSHLGLNEIRTVIWEVLCAAHQKRYREDQIEPEWRKEFPDVDFTPKRSKRRTSNLSTASSGSRGASNSPPQPSPSSSRPPLLESKSIVETDPFYQPSSTSKKDLGTVFRSTEPVSPSPSTPDATSGTKDISQFASSGVDDGSCQPPDLSLENGVVDHQWGDSSADVGGEVSKSRILHYSRDADGQWQKYESVEDAIRKNCVELRRDPRTPPRTPEARPSAAILDEATSSFGGKDRSSLSPEYGRKESRYEKSRSRSQGSRSPSTPPTSDRGNLAFRTMAGDVMFDYHARYNEDNVVSLLRRPLPYTDTTSFGKTGWIYAIRDPELDLVKIGLTREESKLKPADKRFHRLKSDCQLSLGAYIIHDPKQIPVQAFRRLEELVHEDLRPHRWYFDCECGLKRGRRLYETEHHEWYEISDRDAIETIHVWREFILQEPYGLLRNNAYHNLQDEWIQRIENRPEVHEDERHEHHQRRVHRWRSLFSEVDSATSTASRQSVLEPKSEENQEIKVEDDPRTSLSLDDIPPASSDMAPPTYHLYSEMKPDIRVNGDHYSIPTTPALSAASVTRPSSVDVAGNRLSNVSIDRPAEPPPSEREHGSNSTSLHGIFNLDSASRLEAESPDVHDFATPNFRLANLFGAMDTFLRKQLEGLSTRSPYEDLFTFRWPITSAVILALYSPHAPPLLSAFVWITFLPFFVAELREWA